MPRRPVPIPTFSGGAPPEESIRPWRPTLDEAIEFVSWVASDLAQRTGKRGHRQEQAMSGAYVSRQGRIEYLRGSDLSERIYVSVRSLELAGENNVEACRTVAAKFESRLGKSRRGRPRASQSKPDFLDTVESVRSRYNKFKAQHPWKEQLPKHDAVLDSWRTRFDHHKEWRDALTLESVGKSLSGGISGYALAERMDKKLGPHGPNLYEVVTSLTKPGIMAVLRRHRDRLPSPAPEPGSLEGFVDEFLDWPRYRQRIRGVPLS